MNLKKRLYICKMLLYFIIFCVVSHGIGCNVVFANDDYNSNDTQSGAEKAYQEFLDGKRKLYIEDDIFEILHMLQYGSELESFRKTGIYMEDILKQINPIYMEYEEDKRISFIEYTYLDCGNDGNKELAVRFAGITPVDDMRLTFIIVYENGKLYLRHAYEAWSRNSVDLYYYGYMKESGSSGAASGSCEEAYLDKSGRKVSIYMLYYYLHTIKDEELYSKLGDTGQAELECMEYTIQDKTYYCFPGLDPDENAEFYELYEQKYEKLYTVDEIEELIEDKKAELDIKEKWLETEEPDWKMLENASYRQYVKKIDLMECRKERTNNSNSPLKDQWISCEQEKFYYTSTIKWECFEINLIWRSAMDYVLSDYCKRANIPDGEWSLQRLVSYGDGLYAFTVRGENNRELCFLMNNQAIKFDLEEYTEYIMAVDFQFSEDGSIPWHSMSYDSMLKWTPYQQPSIYSEELYKISGNEDELYAFEHQGCHAINQYLKNRNADTSMEWRLDTDTVCPIGQGRMVICRYTCGEQEVVMILDDENKNFAIVKELMEVIAGNRKASSPYLRKNSQPLHTAFAIPHALRAFSLLRS